MPLRIIGYDGAEYRAQINHKNCRERLDVPEKIKPFVNDYKVNLFEIAYLSKELPV